MSFLRFHLNLPIFRAEIEDETAERPEDWDENQPKEIIDESATKPSDWLEEEVYSNVTFRILFEFPA